MSCLGDTHLTVKREGIVEVIGGPMYKRSDGCHYLRLQSQTRDSNPEPSAYKAVALPIAPAWHFCVEHHVGLEPTLFLLGGQTPWPTRRMVH